MASSRKIILREVRRLEESQALLELLRLHSKNDTGTRLSEFGRAILSASKDTDLTQGQIAKILQITTSAVSQHLSKL
jgi:DNA-directed RNA polymerase specialized sigma subunit